MTIVCKFYHNPAGYIKRVTARVYWTPDFMELLARRLGFYGEAFTMKQIEEFLSNWSRISKNAVRHKILRLYKRNWLKRELKEIYINRIKRKIFFYSFSERAKKYYIFWRGFNKDRESPLMKRIPEIPA